MAVRKQYTDELKAKACKLVADGLTHKEVGKTLKISPLLIPRWLTAAKKAKKASGKKATVKKATVKKPTVKKATVKKATAKKVAPRIAGGILGIELQTKIDQLEGKITVLKAAREVLLDDL